MQHVSIRTFDNWRAISYYFICPSRRASRRKLEIGVGEEKRAAFLLRDDYYDDNNNNNIVKFLRDSFESPSFLANFNCQCFERRPSFRPFRVYIYIRFNFAKYEIKEKEEGDTPGVFRVR